MARIVIDYAPDAEADARALAAELGRRGHEAVLRPENEEALYEAPFDAAIVVWSRAGVENERLNAFAAQARGLGILVSTRRAGLPIDRIPADFREAAAPATGDVDAILARTPPPSAQPRPAAAPDEANVKRIFLSYAMSDRAVAANIADELRRRGHDVFMPEPEAGGAAHDFEGKIRDAVARAGLTVAVISPAYLESPYVLAELELARATHGPGGILPALIVPTNLAALPGSLRGTTILQPGDDLAEDIAEAVSRRATPPVVFRGGASQALDNSHGDFESARSDFGADEPKPAPPRDEPAPRAEGAGAGKDPGGGERRQRTFHIGGVVAKLKESANERARARVEGVGAATPVERKPAPVPAPAVGALEVEAGKLVHKIPDKMWLGEPESVEVRIGREAAAGLTSGLVGRGGLTEENIPIVETMSVSLYGRGGAFDIERQSETTQLVKSDAVANTLFATTDFGCWTWAVTPRKTGAQNLFVKVSAGLKDSRGVPTTAALPDRTFTVSVAVDKGRAAAKFLRAALLTGGGAVAAGLLGAITQDLWWPWLKALFLGPG